VFKNIFQKSQGQTGTKSPTVLSGPRVARHSSGWSALQKSLKGETGLRVLDIGPTSPTNINFLTNMGQSVYMSDLVPEAHRPEWKKKAEGDDEPRFDVEGFLGQNLHFADREFDVVLLWTTLDYLPGALVTPVVERLHASMRPGGKVLALFHNKKTGDNTAYCRYHLTDSDAIEMQATTPVAMQQVFTNRSIEKTFGNYAGYKFFLAKDNLYEVIITR
jgi:hypothetical protein